MNILVHTDKNIDGRAEHSDWLKKTVKENLERYSDITRVELHLSDENAGKSGPDDKKCLIEARLPGVPAAIVTAKSETIDQAVLDALVKMDHLLKSLAARRKE